MANFKYILPYLLPPRESKPRPASQTTVTAYADLLLGTGAEVTALSDPALNDLLGSFDQLAIEVITDQVTASIGPVSLTARIAHSSDGQHWLYKSTVPEVVTPPILSEVGPTYMEIGFDDGKVPTLGLVRLEIRLSAVAGPVAAQVRVTVTANDLHERAFAAKVTQVKEKTDRSTYSLCYPEGSRLSPSRIIDILGYLWKNYNHTGVELAMVNGVATSVVVVPKGTMICFDEGGQYLLVDHGQVVWSSLAYAHDTAPPKGGNGPPKSANDPQVPVTIKQANP